MSDAPNTKAPAGHAYEFGSQFSPKGWTGEPVLVLQPQYGLFLDLKDAVAARGRMRPDIASQLSIALVQLSPPVSRDT